MFIYCMSAALDVPAKIDQLNRAIVERKAAMQRLKATIIQKLNTVIEELPQCPPPRNAGLRIVNQRVNEAKRDLDAMITRINDHTDINDRDVGVLGRVNTEKTKMYRK